MGLLQRDTAGQTIRVFAFTKADGEPALDDEANITATVTLDDGTPTAKAAPTASVEISGTTHPGVYVFTMTQAETNAVYHVDLHAVSATAGVECITIDGRHYTVTPGFHQADLDAAVTRILDYLTEVVVEGTVQTVAGAGDYTLSTNLSAVDGHYDRMFIIPQDGPAVGQPRVISTYTGATRRAQHLGSGAELTAPFTSAPEVGNTLRIKGLVGSL